MTTHFDWVLTDRAGESESPISRRDPSNPTLFRLCFAPNRQRINPVITISDCPLDAENFLSPSFERQDEGMPPKRERERDELDEGGSSTTSAPSKKQARAVWTADDEAKFDAALYQLAKAELWKVAKEIPALKARGANGIRSHLDAKFKHVKN